MSNKDCHFEGRQLEMSSQCPEISQSALQNADDKNFTEDYVAEVKGIPVGQSQVVKQLVVKVVGLTNFRLLPAAKNCPNVYLQFKNLADLDKVVKQLHGTTASGYKLIVNRLYKRLYSNVKDTPQMGDNDSETLNVWYKQQLKLKTEYIRHRMSVLGELLEASCPLYKDFIAGRRKKFSGNICILDDIKQCPMNDCQSNVCKMVVGSKKGSGIPTLGLAVDNGVVQDNPVNIERYHPSIQATAKALTSFVEKSGKPPYNHLKGKGFWDKVDIRSSATGDVLLYITVHLDNQSASVQFEKFKLDLFKLDLLNFFEVQEGKDCSVVSISLEILMQGRAPLLEWVMGKGFLSEKVCHLTIKWVPSVNFGCNVAGIEEMLRTVTRYLLPEKQGVVVDIGCGVGLIGQYLSMVCNNVLGIDTPEAVEWAEKNAEYNNLKNCKYLGGDFDSVMSHPNISTISTYKSGFVVINTTCGQVYSASFLNSIRNTECIKRIALVTVLAMDCLQILLTLADPNPKEKLGYPFFPVRAVPVDTMPHAPVTEVLIFMERTPVPNLQGLKSVLQMEMLSVSSKIAAQSSSAEEQSSSKYAKDKPSVSAGSLGSKAEQVSSSLSSPHKINQDRDSSYSEKAQHGSAHYSGASKESKSSMLEENDKRGIKKIGDKATDDNFHDRLHGEDHYKRNEDVNETRVVRIKSSREASEKRRSRSGERKYVAGSKSESKYEGSRHTKSADYSSSSSRAYRERKRDERKSSERTKSGGASSSHTRNTNTEHKHSSYSRPTTYQTSGSKDVKSKSSSHHCRDDYQHKSSKQKKSDRYSPTHKSDEDVHRTVSYSDSRASSVSKYERSKSSISSYAGSRSKDEEYKESKQHLKDSSNNKSSCSDRDNIASDSTDKGSSHRLKKYEDRLNESDYYESQTSYTREVSYKSSRSPAASPKRTKHKRFNDGSVDSLKDESVSHLVAEKNKSQVYTDSYKRKHSRSVSCESDDSKESRSASPHDKSTDRFSSRKKHKKSKPPKDSPLSPASPDKEEKIKSPDWLSPLSPTSPPTVEKVRPPGWQPCLLNAWDGSDYLDGIPSREEVKERFNQC